MAQRPLSEETRDRLVFYPVAVLGAVFCLTVFISLASYMGDPQVPAKQWIQRHSGSWLIMETALLVVVSLLAMTIDRVRTLRKLRAQACRESKVLPDSSAEESPRVD